MARRKNEGRWTETSSSKSSALEIDKQIGEHLIDPIPDGMLPYTSRIRAKPRMPDSPYMERRSCPVERLSLLGGARKLGRLLIPAGLTSYLMLCPIPHIINPQQPQSTDLRCLSSGSHSYIQPRHTLPRRDPQKSAITHTRTSLIYPSHKIQKIVSVIVLSPLFAFPAFQKVVFRRNLVSILERPLRYVLRFNQLPNTGK